MKINENKDKHNIVNPYLIRKRKKEGDASFYKFFCFRIKPVP